MRRVWTAAWACVAVLATQGAPAQEAQPLAACIASLRQELRAHPDVSPRTFDTYTREVQDLRPVIENASRAQPEFQIAIWDYLARRVDARRIAEGR
jgi:membrane-bound lytic murein transglycosylase B